MIIKKNIQLNSGVFLKECYLKVENISIKNNAFKASYSYHADPSKEALQWDYIAGDYNGGNLEEQVESMIDSLVKNGKETEVL